VLTKFQQSEDFRQLAERTRKDYAIQIKIIERAFGDLPIAALSDPRTRNILLEWARTARIGIAATGRLRLGCARSHLGMGARTQTVRTRQPVRAGRVDVRGRRSGRQGLVGAGR